MRIFLKILRSILITLGTVVLGAIIAYNLVPDVYTAASWVKWENLGTPPEKAIRFMGEAFCNQTSGAVVQAASGARYQTCSANGWKGWKEGQDYMLGEPHPCEGERPTPYNPGLKTLPGKPVDCMSKYSWEWSTSEVVTVILEDGSVWRWMFNYGVGTYFLYAFWGAIVGLLAGVGLSIFIWIRERREKQA